MDPQKQYKVLVVEDEADAREIYKDILITGGFLVGEAADGDDALRKLVAEKYDLVLLDIMMPGKDGIQTLSEIKKRHAEFGTPKIIMLTNIGGDIAIDKVMELGADGYMLKTDIEPNDLVGIVIKYLEQ